MVLRILLLFACHAGASASEWHPGEIYRFDVKSLRPTQFTAGLREVKKKVAQFHDVTGGALKAILKGHPVDGVIGPDGSFYILDGHHFALAALQAGVDEIYGHVVRNYSDLSQTEFWDKLEKKGWVYLYRLGEGPLSPRKLPKRLSEMVDDPYRSLAASIRRHGGFEKIEDNFSEFPWAEFLRQHIRLDSTDEDAFQRAASAGYVLARSPLASDLPGYLGNDKKCEKALEMIGAEQ